METSGRPKYQQLADELRRRIAAGALAVGDEVPSTAKLSATYGVSTTVVRAAIRELQSEGLVVGQPGKAVYVQSMNVTPRRPPSATEQLAQELTELRRTVQELSARVAALETPEHR